MVAVLSDVSLYAFTAGTPPTLPELELRYTHQVAGSGSSAEQWHNWIARHRDSGVVIGFVQATVTDDDASIAWLVGVDHQRQGFAIEAAAAMVDWLTSQGTTPVQAFIHPRHVASQRVAERLGLRRTGEVDEDGEEVWRSSTAHSAS